MATGTGLADLVSLAETVGVFGAFVRLAIGLAREPELPTSLHAISALIGCPIAVKVATSFSMVFETQINGPHRIDP